MRTNKNLLPQQFVKINIVETFMTITLLLKE